MSEIRKMICIVCPKGCHLSVDEESLKVTGHLCPRGVRYGKQEVQNPQRVICSTVRCKSDRMPRCPVKTDGTVNKSLIFEAMRVLDQIVAVPPIHTGQILADNICGTEVNIVSTRDIEA